MKIQKARFLAGELVLNDRTSWIRKIRIVDHVQRSGKMIVMYAYSNQELDMNYNPTGRYLDFISGYCSQDHLLRWQSGKNK